MHKCAVCGEYFAARADAQTCSEACRAKGRRQRQADVVAILREQTEAIFDGADTAALTSTAHAARELLGGMAAR